MVLTSIVLLALGNSVGPVWQVFLSSPMPGVTEAIINDTAVLYLSGVAVAIGFRMNLFNIGVEGQYRVATFVAALVAGQAFLPGILNVVLAILVAMLAGGLAGSFGVAALVQRGARGRGRRRTPRSRPGRVARTRAPPSGPASAAVAPRTRPRRGNR